jgi:PPOX class probable F420-dependent enzyme
MTMLSDRTRALLEQPAFAKLTTLDANGAPQMTVMWYRLTGDELRMIAPASAVKARHLARDPRAAIIVDAPDDGYTYVELRCRAEVVHDDAAARRELREIAARYVGERADAFVAGLSADPRVLLVLRPERVREHFSAE